MKPLKQVEHSLHDISSLKRGYTFWGLMLTIAVCALLIWVKYGTWLSHPNEVMMGGGNDGFKNYMTSAWHVKYDSSFVHYSGMNYPFGEHVLFTDNQPILSNMMQWWSRHVRDLSNEVIGVVNLFQICSMLMGCAVLFLLFRKLHLPVWYAGSGAVILTFLAPQYLRFSGHFGLSHTFVIPVMLYWLCRYEERVSKRYPSLHIGFLVWFAAQLHFYYMGLAALFLTLYTGYHILRAFNARNIYSRLSHWVVMVIVPFVFLNIWVHWSDYAADRSASPYGFTAYIGSWEGVFLPYDFMPLSKWISKHIIKIRNVEFEAEAYAGGIALFYTLWLLFSGFKMFHKSWNDAASHRVHKHFLRGIFYAALLLLLFACGFPYAIKSMQWSIDYMGPLKQFRSQGRFTWVYFYVINTLIFYGAWNWGRRFKGFGAKNIFPQFKFIIMGVPLVVLACEAWQLQTLRPVKTGPNVALRTVAAPTPDHWLNKVDFTPYQAILPLPYYHIGSENIWREFDADHYHWVSETAFHTGVPDMGVNMSRTPIGEMVKSVQMALEPCEMPVILDELPDRRPIALFVLASEWDNVQKHYRHLVEKSKLVYESNNVKILRLELDDLWTYFKENRARVATDFETKTLYPIPGTNWLSTKENPFFKHISFDSLTSTQHHFQGKGAFTGMFTDTVMILKDTLPKGKYTISVWTKVNEDLGANHELHIVENSIYGGHEIKHQHEGLRFYLKTVVNGWGLTEVEFENYEGGTMRIFFHKKGAKLPFYMDELLIKSVDTEVYKKEPGWLVRNNYWYRND